MKKLLLIIFMALCTVAVQAQFYVGGTLGASVESNSIAGESHTKQTYSIAPEFGYNITPVWAIGVSFGALYTSVGGDNDYTALGVSSYLRATFANVGRVHFFAEAAFSHEKTKEQTSHVKVDGWGLGLCPGVRIDLTDKLQLVGRTTLFQYAEAGEKDFKVKQTGFAIGNNLELGMQFNF